MTSWPIRKRQDHHWHPMSFLRPTSPVKVQNWNKSTSGLLWLTSKNILSQKRLLRSGNGKFWGLPSWQLPAPSDGSPPQHQVSIRLQHLLVLRLSQHAETSPRGSQIETCVNGFQNLDFSLFLFWKCWRLKCNYFPGDKGNSLFFTSTKELAMMNPFPMVSDYRGIKGGAGDSLSPSCSRIKDKF